MGQRDQQVIGHRSKLHLRVRTLGGQELRILTPRPGTDLLLSNNLFHDTWHILSDVHGAHQLAHLCWFLAHQRHPGTVLLLDAPFVVSSPFDGDRARPVLIVPWELTGLGHKALRALASQRHTLGPPDTTVRIDTHGLPLARDADQRPPSHLFDRSRETMAVRGVFMEYRADRMWLMDLARTAAQLTFLDTACSYNFLADQDGELQVLPDFRERIGAASRARSELGLQPGFATPEQQPLLWSATDAIVRQRERVRERRRPDRA